MKLIGLMLVRNEDWIIGASIPAALRWVDELVVLDHASSDRTKEIVDSFPKDRISYDRWPDETKWDEMPARDYTLKIGRQRGGTHFAIVDADEILTANLDGTIRGEFEKLLPGEVLEVPMLAMRTLDVYQDDDSVWSHAWLSLGFADRPILTWKPSEDNYQHHQRPPKGVFNTKRYLRSKAEGGVMHLQFANRRRLVSKHWWYAYNDHIRWPGREDAEKLSWKYSLALVKTNGLGSLPEEWWANRDKKAIKLDGTPWYDAELRKLITVHGEKAFEGIKLVEKRPV